jgi:hypothetical protein
MTTHDAALAAWVSKVNRMAANIEANAAAMHPSAWSEALAADHARFRKLAAGGPVEPAQMSLLEVAS